MYSKAVNNPIHYKKSKVHISTSVILFTDIVGKNIASPAWALDKPNTRHKHISTSTAPISYANLECIVYATYCHE